jgi:NAD(P)-dependent dehydrogenase (short-subunit alcohol dehydrogenase family)
MGASTAIALAQAGFDVAVTARTMREGEGALPGSLETVTAAIESTGARALPLAMDLTDHDGVAATADATLDTFGRVDLLCNIGIYQGSGSGMFLETSIEEFSKHLDADVLAPVILLQKLVPVMLEQEGGIVVNMSSFVVFNDPPGTPDQNGWALSYAAAKAGIDRVAGGLNAEFGDRGILAYTVDPGFVAYGDDFAAQLDRYVGMPVTPPDAIGAAIVWLVTSPDAPRLLHKRIYLPAITQKYGLLPGWEGPGSAFPA